MYDFASISRRKTPYKNYIVVKEQLSIETKIIGYKSQGECILLFIRVDEKVAFSALFDCYMTDSTDVLSDILEKYNIRKLDFLCWTHPDLDHSKGMEFIIQKFVDENTQIWIPEGIDENEIDCSQKVRNLFKKLKQCVTRTEESYSVYSASDVKDLLCYNTFCFAKGINEYPLRICAYAPNSKLIRKQKYMEKFIKNDRSIFCVLGLGDIRIFLTGDIENKTISMLPSGLIDTHAHILKIPHHGSDTSTEMLGVCSEGCEVACSTVYRVGKSRLPIKEVMDQYIPQSSYLFCTGNRDKRKETKEYGIVTVNTNVLNNTYETMCEGNSELIVGEY